MLEQFQEYLNGLIEKGWKPWGLSKDGLNNPVICLQQGIQLVGEKIMSYNDLIFGPESGFMDMIEWKNPYREKDYYNNQKEHHIARLAVLNTDEERIQYILDNKK